MYITGENRPIIDKPYTYTLHSLEKFETKPIAVDNTRVVKRNNLPFEKPEKPQQSIVWKIFLGKTLIKTSQTGTLKFSVGNQKYVIVAYVKGKEVARANVTTLGGTPSIKVYWLDDYGQKIINRTVGYLDKVYLIVKAIHIPVGDTLRVTIYEDENADGHGDSSRSLGTYSTSAVNKNGYARVYFSNLQAFRTALNKADYYDESEHEFYAKITYDSHIIKDADTIKDTIQIKVKNELKKLIDPPVKNMPVIVGEVERASTRDDKNVINFTFGVFIDGTMNNKYNTIARVNWEKKRLGETDTIYNEKEHLKVYAKKDADVKDGGKYDYKGDDYKYKYGEVSYENELSNPAILFENYEKAEKNKVFKIYTEGMGTNTLTDGSLEEGSFKDKATQKNYKKDDAFQGSGMGIGNAGIIDRVTRAIEQMVTKIKVDKKEKVGTITIDISGFSRGAAAARHFIHEITLQPYKASGLLLDHSDRMVDSKYASNPLPSNG